MNLAKRHYGYSRWSAASALPTNTSMNPLSPSPGIAEHYGGDLIAYVLFKKNEVRLRPSRVFTSTSPVDGWKLKVVVHLQHYQTGAYLGEYEIVGIHHFRSGEMAGLIPDFKIKHCVAK